MTYNNKLMQVHELIESLGWKCHNISPDLDAHWIPNSHDTQDVYLFEGGKADREYLEIIWAENYDQALNFWHSQTSSKCYPTFHYKAVNNLRVILEASIYNKSGSDFIQIDSTLEEMGWKCAYFNETTAHWVPNNSSTQDCYLLEEGLPGNQTISLIYAENYESAQDFWHRLAADSCEPSFHYGTLENLKIILKHGI